MLFYDALGAYVEKLGTVVGDIFVVLFMVMSHTIIIINHHWFETVPKRGGDTGEISEGEKRGLNQSSIFNTTNNASTFHQLRSSINDQKRCARTTKPQSHNPSHDEETNDSCQEVQKQTKQHLNVSAAHTHIHTTISLINRLTSALQKNVLH